MVSKKTVRCKGVDVVQSIGSCVEYLQLSSRDYGCSHITVPSGKLHVCGYNCDKTVFVGVHPEKSVGNSKSLTQSGEEPLA